LFGAARAAIEARFNHHMNVIKAMDEKAFKYLEKIDPRSWSRHAFGTNCKSDMISNNIAESFNHGLRMLGISHS
jgi:hypothetical protein